MSFALAAPGTGSAVATVSARARAVARGAVLVLHADTAMGLAIVRSLGRGGVRVVAGTAVPDGVGRFSRYAQGVVRVPRGADLAQVVLDAAVQHGVTYVIATGEDQIVRLNAARERIEPRVRLLFPPAATMELALRKDRTIDIARRAGVPVPCTVFPRGPEDFERCLALTFPVILKPADRLPRDDGRPVLDFKCERIDTPGQLARRLAEFSRTGVYPLVQEWVPGRGVGVEALFRRGEPVLVFQHRRIHELPPEGGVSVVCESAMADPDLADQAIRLLTAMRWDGVAMVEFRRDEATGRAVLMEVNGRFWGSLPLAVHAGADFPLLLWRSAAEPAAPMAPVYRAGVRCRESLGDLRWLVQVLRRGGRPRLRAVAEWLGGFGPRTRDYYFAADDPAPGFAAWFLRIAKALHLQQRDV